MILNKDGQFNDYNQMDDLILQELFPTSNPLMGQRPGPGPGPGPRPPMPGPGPGPRPPMPGPGPGPGPGPRPPMPGPGPGPFPPPPPGIGPIAPPPGTMQPLSAPPNFTPELSQNERAQFSKGGEAFFLQQGGIRRCLNRFVYMWLIGGDNFWFYPTFIGRNHIEGFRWRRGRWVYERINVRRILFFRCF